MVLLLSKITILLIVLSCGKQKFPDYKEEQEIKNYNLHDLFYSGRLKSLNSFTGPIIKYELRIEGKQFYSKILMQNGPRLTKIKQYIHSGEKCPDSDADLNKDGTIDHEEVLISSGEILIPLDKIINSQDEGSEWSPETDDEGFYLYSKAASVLWLMNDLSDADVYPQDGIAKLKSDESLNLKNRTLILYGSKGNPLMPIACSEL